MSENDEPIEGPAEATGEAGAAPEAEAAEAATEAPPPPLEEEAPPPLGEEAPAPPDEEAPADEAPVLPPEEIRATLEALIFAATQPITPRQINQVLGGVPPDAWKTGLEELKAEYARTGRGLQLVEVAGGFQITTRPEYNDWLRALLDPKSTTRLSIQALETLAVIAYKQPVTQPEVIELRGVKSGGVIKTLLEKRLIRIVGRKEVVGRPMLYGTTRQFLLHFGLKDLGELPRIEEFAEVLGEEVDVAGLKRAIEAPRPVEIPLSEGDEEAAPDPGGGEEAAEADPDGEPDAPAAGTSSDT